MSNVVERDTGLGRFPKAYAYFCLYFGLFALALICLTWTPFALVLQALLPKQIARPVGRRGITYGFRLYLWILTAVGACRFDLSALDRLRDAGPMILAPNHPSLLDAVMIISRLPNIACIMKAELMGNLLLGAGARLAGYIPNKHPRAMIKAACRDLDQGGQLLLFPEGTRTTRPPINPLVPATGAIARLAEVPVQTILIETSSAFLAKGWPLFRCPEMPLQYRVRLGRRLDPPGKGQDLGPMLEDYFHGVLSTRQAGAR
ncbi:lysophospholipid acyltransferase family protein [Thiorhodococcus minor]|uniref:1-acyl-sn-glycerol-3-phosphate acyltransferase n=1 Tax=Thiorhodococcus minor TaxID=57489 RepID=A0A6M0K132_9GAMM|nr:lysophospholipid acyltransferase family protein [Thiorhodococcus minor]NEV63472.1 1-acyl-sn-glycerol-3-phosphate acyltransferase [Thiorhodococcus minor]